jgi:hypothetical protein
MAIRKPLVLVNGQLQQLQAGDVVQSFDILPQVVNEPGGLVFGNIVYNDGADTVRKARANAAGTKDVLGIVMNGTVAQGGTANILLSGPATGTTGQWDAQFGTTGGLAPRARYFLSDAVAGQASADAPIADGSYVIEIGVGASPTELVLSAPYRSILL